MRGESDRRADRLHVKIGILVAVLVGLVMLAIPLCSQMSAGMLPGPTTSMVGHDQADGSHRHLHDDPDVDEVATGAPAPRVEAQTHDVLAGCIAFVMFLLAASRFVPRASPSATGIHLVPPPRTSRRPRDRQRRRPIFGELCILRT